MFLSPLTPKMLHSDCGMHGIGEKTDLTLADGLLFKRFPGVSNTLYIGLALIWCLLSFENCGVCMAVLLLPPNDPPKRLAKAW